MNGVLIILFVCKQQTKEGNKESSGFLSIPSMEKKSSSTGDLSVIARGDPNAKLGVKKSFNR